MAESDYQKYLKGIRTEPYKRVATMLGTNPVDPDQAAESLRIGEQMGVPAGAVLGAPEMFRTQANNLNTAEALEGAPRLADWLTDPMNGALAKDDIQSLSWFERNFGAAGRAIGRGTRRLTAIPDYMGAVSNSTRAGDVGKSYDDLLAEEVAKWGEGVTIEMLPAQARQNAVLVARQRFDNIEGQGEAERLEYIRRGADRLASAESILSFAANIPMSESATAFRDGSLANADNSLLGTLAAFVEDPIGGAAFIAETAAETLPVLAAATATTATTRSPVAGVGVMSGGSFLTENATSAMQFLQERGVDMSTPEAAALVLQDRELMAEAQALGVERGLIIAMFDAVSGGVASTALLESPAGDMVVQGIAQAALGAGGEASAQLATEGELDWRDVVVEGLAEFATAPIEVVGVGGRELFRNMGLFSRAGAAQEAIAEVDEMAAASALKERAPDKFLNAMETMGLGDSEIFVDATTMREFFQAKDIDLDDETLQAWGIDPDAFAEQEAIGGDVGIPMSNYATHISGTDNAEFFATNGRLDAEAMSVSDAEAFNERVAELANDAFAEAEERATIEASNAEAATQVNDHIYSQLREAGRSPDVAKNEALIVSSFFEAMSSRAPEQSERIANMLGVEVRGPEQELEMRRRSALDAHLNTLRKNPDPMATVANDSFLAFIQSQGGIKDTGGDVAAMEPPAGMITSTAEDVAARANEPTLDGVQADLPGVALDDLGRAAIDAGFFAGQQENPDGTVADEASLALDAVERSLRGETALPTGVEPDAELAALATEIERRKLDITGMTNDEVIAALDAEPEVDPFTLDGWQEVPVQVELDVGGSMQIDAGTAEAVITERISEARKLQRCLNG